MIRHPQLKAHFHVEIVPGEGVFLISEFGHAVLSGPLFEVIIPLIDGLRSSDEIAVALSAQVPSSEVFSALALLERKGYLVESNNAFPEGESALWAIQGVDLTAAMDRLESMKLSVKAFGEVAIQPFLALLSELRMQICSEGDLTVVLTDDYLRSELQTCNEDALRTGRPWLLVRPVGCEIWIGPLFTPGQSACWECLAQRLRLHRAVEMFIQQKLNRVGMLPIPRAATPATTQIAYGITATQIATRVVRGKLPGLEDQILSLDLLSWKTQFHKLIRQPYCPACGNAESAATQSPKPLSLESRPKTFRDEGGHRVAKPEETLQRYGHHVSPITGAVNVLQRRLVNDYGVLHVYGADDNFAAQYQTLWHLQKSLRSRSSGKGTTDLQARVSCLCEALERYSGVFRGTEMRRTSSLIELAGLGIHPNECMLFSDEQYRQREVINARGSRFNQVPLPFDPDRKVEWTPVWSLTHGSHRYLPTGFCYYSYPMIDADRTCAPCSNGNAAGNTLEEAILQGFFELVERDSVAVWWYNRLRRPAVDLDSFDDAFLTKLRAFLKDRDRELWVLDLTTDLSIPSFVALSRRSNRVHESIMLGFGAHFDPRIAILRAVTELNQSLVALLVDESRPDQPFRGIEHKETLDWLKTATLANQPHLLPDDAVPARTAGSYPLLGTDDLRDDVLLCRRLVEDLGMEMLVLDQTRSEIGLPVVKVLVPGLRHFWARFAPGRLYDVPVALGWRPGRLTEAELNPVPMFL
jgi:bacteriocin biosynthesis cyclodehydratase domain-containing protein